MRELQLLVDGPGCENDIGGMDAVTECFGTGGFHRRQAVSQHRIEDVDHLAIAIGGAGKSASDPLDGGWQHKTFEHRPGPDGVDEARCTIKPKSALQIEQLRNETSDEELARSLAGPAYEQFFDSRFKRPDVEWRGLEHCQSKEFAGYCPGIPVCRTREVSSRCPGNKQCPDGKESEEDCARSQAGSGTRCWRRGL